MARLVLTLVSCVLLCGLVVPASAFAQAGKRCRSVAEISRLEIGPQHAALFGRPIGRTGLEAQVQVQPNGTRPAQLQAAAFAPLGL